MISVIYLVQDDTNAPPVTSAIVVLASDDFWRHVLAGTDNALGELSSLSAVQPVKNRSVGSVLLHSLSLACGKVAINDVDRVARGLALFFLLDILTISLNV